MHHEAKVGHLGGNLSCLDALLVVFHDFMKDGDRFVLSKGHSVGALYITLWSCGKLQEDSLRTFHADGTYLAGHPPVRGIEDISFATGSLGHGLSLSAGMALGMRLQSQVNHIYCLTSDGEWQEGSTWEALIFSHHHQLSNLTILVDHNNLQGFGTTADVASMSPLWERLKGFDLDTAIVNGHDLDEISSALSQPQKGMKIIFLKTTKGRGISGLEDKLESHYLPISDDQFLLSMMELSR